MEEKARHLDEIGKHRQADVIRTSIQNIKDNWERFQKMVREQKGGGHKGIPHSDETRARISRSQMESWKTETRQDAVARTWRAKRYRREGKCLIRFPRLPRSVDKEWLRAYRKTYRRSTGKHLGKSDIVLYNGAN